MELEEGFPVFPSVTYFLIRVTFTSFLQFQAIDGNICAAILNSSTSGKEWNMGQMEHVVS